MTRVFAGLSGGVDSAIAAALLKQQGHGVVGVFIKIWQPEFLECTWRTDRLDAMRVAATLGIPFKEVDLSREYESEVVNKMLASYRSGETPNPDVLCNRSIKFGAFSRWARSEGADAVATGHYARIEQGAGGMEMWRGVDAEKDQSYFLHLLSESDLARAMFPLGRLTKKQVRAKAHSLRLPVADKPDSQGLCFVGDVSMRDFLRRFIAVEDGQVTDTTGTVIGMHEGAVLYTIGQRHGFSVTVPGLTARPHYVIAVDVPRNILVVSAERMDAACTSAALREVHWISGVAPALPARLLAQTRYREKPVAVTLENNGGGMRANFSEPHVVSPGQAIVFYEGERCLGGAVMEKESAKRHSVHSEARASGKAVQ